MAYRYPWSYTTICNVTCSKKKKAIANSSSTSEVKLTLMRKIINHLPNLLLSPISIISCPLDWFAQYTRRRWEVFFSTADTTWPMGLFILLIFMALYFAAYTVDSPQLNFENISKLLLSSHEINLQLINF